MTSSHSCDLLGYLSMYSFRPSSSSKLSSQLPFVSFSFLSFFSFSSLSLLPFSILSLLPFLISPSLSTITSFSSDLFSVLNKDLNSDILRFRYSGQNYPTLRNHIFNGFHIDFILNDHNYIHYIALYAYLSISM